MQKKVTHNADKGNTHTHKIKICNNRLELHAIELNFNASNKET